jgi:hypothetical protein
MGCPYSFVIQAYSNGGALHYSDLWYQERARMSYFTGALLHKFEKNITNRSQVKVTTDKNDEMDTRLY